MLTIHIQIHTVTHMNVYRKTYINMYMNMYTNMNMYRYVSEAWPTNLSSSMCRKGFLYLMRLIYFLVAFSSHSFFSPPSPLTKRTSLPLCTHSLGFRCPSSAQLPSQPCVQCVFHRLPVRFHLRLTPAPKMTSKPRPALSHLLGIRVGNSHPILQSSISLTPSPANETSKVFLPLCLLLPNLFNSPTEDSDCGSSETSPFPPIGAPHYVCKMMTDEPFCSPALTERAIPVLTETLVMPTGCAVSVFKRLVLESQNQFEPLAPSHDFVPVVRWLSLSKTQSHLYGKLWIIIASPSLDACKKENINCKSLCLMSCL